MGNTIKWYKVKCSLYKQTFGVKRWKDLMDFMNKTIGFDYEITGQKSDQYEGVDGYIEGGSYHRL